MVLHNVVQLITMRESSIRKHKVEKFQNVTRQVLESRISYAPILRAEINLEEMKRDVLSKKLNDIQFAEDWKKEDWKVFDKVVEKMNAIDDKIEELTETLDAELVVVTPDEFDEGYKAGKIFDDEDEVGSRPVQQQTTVVHFRLMRVIS